MKISSKLCVEFLNEKAFKISSKNEKLPYEFSFDRVFDMSSTQHEVFELAAKPIINSNLLFIKFRCIIRF